MLFILWNIAEYAKEFVDALNNEKDDNKVKSVFGKHIRLLHESCNKKLLEFAKAAHESGKIMCHINFCS